MKLDNQDKSPEVKPEYLNMVLPLYDLIKAVVKEVAKETVREILNEVQSVTPDKKDEDEIMTVQELSEYSKLSKSWLYSHYKEIPHFYKKSEGKKKGRPYFKKSAFDKWLDQYREEPMDGAGHKVKNDRPEPASNEATSLKARPFRQQTTDKTTSL